jgi:transcriptional regulator with XRE-family HTH domain
MANRTRKLGKSFHGADYRRFCELLVERREAAGLTQQKLATKLGKPQSFIAKYEGGERRLDVVEFIHIARAMGADPVRLLKSLLREIG